MRKLALLVGVTTALTLIKPTSDLIITARHLPPIDVWRTVSALSTAIFLYTVNGVNLLFYFVLSYDRGTLYVSRSMRFLGRGAGVVQGIILAADLPTRFSALMSDASVARNLEWRHGAAGLWIAARNPFTIAGVTNLLTLFLTASFVALLLALSRDPDDSPIEAIPVSRLLRVVTEMAVIATGLLVVLFLVGVALVPSNYSALRDAAYQLGKRPPRFMDVLMFKVHQLVAWASLFVAPFLVYKGSKGEGVGATETAEEDSTVPSE